MHRHLFNIFIATMTIGATLMMTGCGKVVAEDIEEETDRTEVAGDGAFKVDFIVDGYEIGSFDDNGEPQTRAVVDASKLGTKINFAVFQNGNKVKSVSQSSEEGDFGKVSVRLDEGDYEVVLLVHSAQGSATISAPDQISFPNNKTTDTFSYYKSFSLSTDITFSVNVARKVAMYRIIIQDTIPARAAHIKFYYIGGSSTFNAATGFGWKESRQTEWREITSHEAGQTFSLYTFPHSAKDVLTKMHIQVYNSDKSAIVHEAEYHNIPIEQNKITTHTCNLFTDNGDDDSGDDNEEGGNDGGDDSEEEGGDRYSHFSVKGNDEWDGELTF